jgi:hypothetical protein
MDNVRRYAVWVYAEEGGKKYYFSSSRKAFSFRDAINSGKKAIADYPVFVLGEERTKGGV